MFRGIIDKGKGDLVALRQERPVPPLNADKTAPPPLAPEQLTTWTYKQYFDQSMALGAGCIGAGFVRHDCVLIFGFNSPEWLFSAMAGICAGGPFTGIYPTDTPEQVTWKAKLTNASVAFVEDESAEEKILSSIEDIPYLKAIVCWNHDCASGRSSAKRTDGSEVKRLTMEELKDLGKGHEDSVQERLKNDLPTDCCDLIFTSGTTGNPKAVMVSNDNVAFMGRSLIRPMTQYMDTSVSQRSLSYLPLSHIAGSLSDIFMPIVATYDFDEKAAGWELTFARPYDLKAGSLKDRLLLTRPTVFMGVPRVWEKIHEKMLAIGAKVKGTKRKVANWAKGKALKFAEEQQIGGSGKIPFGYPTAKKLILNKIKNALGLDQVVMGLTGAAPMKLETLKYFGSIGIQINEVYGMSETTGVCTLGTPSSHLWGSCGFPLPGVEVEIFQVDPDDPNKKKKCPRTKNLFKPQPEEEGEICFRGRNIMLGYMSNPALGEEHMKEIYDKNAAALDNEGWLHSGDKGCKDVNNMVRVTGRFKELIIGAGGENIAPVPIEDSILKESKGVISNVMMVGDQRKFNVCLVTLAAEGATGELPGTDVLDGSAATLVPGVSTIPQACENEAFIKFITDAITATNNNGAVCPSNAAKVQKFTILPKDFSVLDGDFTPTLKTKRSVIQKKYVDILDALYDSSETYVPYKTAPITQE